MMNDTPGGPPDLDVKALQLLALEMAPEAGEDRRALLAAAAALAALLFRHAFTHEVGAMEWPDRDRLLFAPALRPLACALARLLGQERLAKETVRDGEETATDNCDLAAHGFDAIFRQPGHGLAVAVGMARAAALLRARFGPEIINHATWVLIDDAEVEPGIAQEAVAIAPYLAPHRLIVLHLTARREDDRHPRRFSCPDHLARFAAAGWHVQRVSAHHPAAMREALEKALDQDAASEEEWRPAYVAVEYEVGALQTPQAMREALGWSALPAGEVPGEVRDAWRLAGLRGRKARRAWRERLERLTAADHAAFGRRFEKALPESFREFMREKRVALAEKGDGRPMPALVRELLATSAPHLPGLTVLSALHEELHMPCVDDDGEEDASPAAAAPSPRVQDIGLRAAVLAAVLAGMAAHGGCRPLGLVWRAQLETMLPLLREAAEAGIRFSCVVLDDAACHLPLAAILPAGVEGLVPADAAELAECWQLAQQHDGPVLLQVAADARPAVRTEPEKINLSALGAYELFTPAEATPQAVVFASGRALAAALAAARHLEDEGLAVRVVSMPAPGRFFLREEEARRRVLGEEKHRFVIAEVPALLKILSGAAEAISPCRGDGRILSDDDLKERLVEVLRAHLAPSGEEENGARDSDGKEPA